MFDRANFADTCPQRANVIEWLPFEKGQSVVIHSSAPSTVISMLRDKEVQLQVLSDAQVEKLAANPGKGSLDYVIVLGMGVNAKFLSGLYRKVKPEGHVVVLLHNKYGMSYFAGKPAYRERYYAALTEQNAGKSAFYSFKGIEKLCKEAGIRTYSKFYLDPDGEFLTNIYSDKYLPRNGDCSIKPRNFTYDRLAMFDETAAWNQAAQEEMYPIFANDYLLVTGPELPQVMVRYSNDRAASYQIKTEMYACESGLEVHKTALHPQGVPHLVKMAETYQKLCEQYDSSVFTIVPCTWNGVSLVSPFVKGVTLSERMKEALAEGDEKAVFTLFHSFLNKLRQAKNTACSNYDFIFGNILIDGDNWQVIDYEWTMDKAVPAEELAFRAAYCFSLEHKEFPFEDICRILNLDKQKVQQLISRETAYQQSITGSQASLGSLCEEHGGDVYTKEALLRALEISTEDHKAQIYEDSGKGFREEQSYFVEHTLTRHDEMELTLQVAVGMKALRVDPCEEPCLVQIKRLWWNGEELYLDKQITVNGIKGKAGKNSYPEYVFATRDPNFTISLEKLPSGEKSFHELKLQLEIHKISLQLANTLTKSMKRII